MKIKKKKIIDIKKLGPLTLCHVSQTEWIKCSQYSVDFCDSYYNRFIVNKFIQ